MFFFHFLFKFNLRLKEWLKEECGVDPLLVENETDYADLHSPVEKRPRNGSPNFLDFVAETAQNENITGFFVYCC